MKTDKKTGEKLLLCPRCRVDMKKLVKKDVVIDICKKCGGMWVDKGELEKLAMINAGAAESSRKS
jgi:Zn-finger nucleic acid-binding protein